MHAFLAFVFFILYHAQEVRGIFCDEVKYKFINDTRRSIAIESSPPYLCDRGYIEDDKWYRFYSASGNTIPTENPSLRHCSTYVPIWFKGEHPTAENVEVDAKACAAIPFVFPIGCGVSYDIKVVKCPGDFYLYKLKEPKQCSLAYCAGSKKPVECSLTGTSLPVCPGVVPNVKSISASIVEEKTENVQLKCVWNYDGNAALVEFQVRWIGDKLNVERQINKTFSGTGKKEFLYKQEHVGRDPNTGQSDSHGYAFSTEAFCEIRSRYIDGSWSKWMKSNRLYTGITVYPKSIHLEECGDEEYRKVFITLTPYLPIRNTSYMVGIDLDGQTSVDGVCLRGISPGKRCQLQLTDQHSSTSPLRIMLRTKCSKFAPTTGKSAVNVKLTSVLGVNNPFWQSHVFPEIKIFIKKSDKKICKSETDPHFTTFDGRHYNFFGIGTFLLYHNKHIGTRVEARQKSCGSTASCNCGIAIKDGAFYKIFDMCQVEHAKDGTPSKWWENPKNLIIRKRGLKESQTNGFYTVETAGGSSTTYEIYLPSGVMVTVKRMYWGLSTYIKAPTPFHQDNQLHTDFHSEGLCGNYNGDRADDFDHRKEVEFGESNRINGESLFGYKGDEDLEEKVLDDCKTGAICSCENNKDAICGMDAIKFCFPSERGKHHKVINAGLCKGLAKRDLTSRDDDIDDQDDIPPFNPPQQNVTRVPSWPTKGGLIEENVREICNAKIRNSKAGESCGNITGVDIDALVGQCISDIQATDNTAWATDNFAAMQETCKKNIYKNTSFYQNSTDGELKLDTEFIASLCPNDCSDHGNCSNATCTCDEFYTAADCSISLKDRPFVSGIRKDGICDVRRRPCRNVGIYGFPFLDSENLTCHVQEYKVIESAWTPSNSISLHPGRLVDLTEVKCSLPETPVNIGDYGNQGVTAAGLKISISNNGINASEAFMLFITYDSVCQECNTTKGCRVKTDACFISGHCFAQNESHPNDWCQQCLPHISTTSWLKRRDNQRPSFTTSTVLYAFRGKQLRVQLRAIDPEYRTIRYTFVQNETLGASLTESGIFEWTTNTNDSTMFIFKVTDECGAYSVLNAFVEIKECPCQNYGECHPDYRDLDGAGNFTCFCPAGYTGVLCELDVDECNVFKPCFNGSCNNEQPGFSCSCFPGYTGNRCQTEVDECASKPCFPDVSCTDMIALFSCGACPSGYSGNGKNCTRMDGEIDPCIRNPKVCHSEAKCVYNNGSFVCQCANGYIGNGKNNCTDVNECMETPKVCHPNANCSNTDGHYSCECLSGFSGDGYLNCSDVNECSQSPDNCPLNANCTNTKGSYSCKCLRGYTGDAILNCSDINECKLSPSVCHSLAKCFNIEGSFSCQCEIGYTGDGIVNCTDVNECTLSPFVCHANAQCTNTIGSYSCQCNEGYLGDGKKNCTENKSPQFNTPSAMYAIMNTDFQIRIEADDPEEEDIVYILMSNGTLSTAQITEQGLLTVSDVKFNGTVYIRVEDERGAWNILILHVIAMQCPCENHGKCYRKQNIPYPVQPSHYCCQCEEPYTGHLCEIRPNPCDEQPCYPGLKCLPAQNSEGFSCEDCPLLFKGDGKHCELNRTKEIEKNSVQSKMTLTNEEWDHQLTVKTSKVYKKLVSRLTIEIRKIYISIPEFSYFIVKGFSRGSIVVDFELIFSNKVDGPLEPLLKVERTGKLGNMTFEMNEESDAGDDDGNTLDTTILIVIIVVAVVLLILIVFGVCRCIRRQRVHREEELRRKRESSMEDSKPVGISYQEAADGAAGEEMDLKVFDNEAVRLDEDTHLEP